MKKQIVALSLAVTMILVSGGCSPQKQPPASSNLSSNSIAVDAEKQSFKELTDEFFIESVKKNISSVNSLIKNPEKYGINIEELDIELGDFSDAAAKEAVDESNDILKKIKQYDRSELSKEEQILYDIFLHDMPLLIENIDLRYYNEPLKTSDNAVVSAAFSLSQFKLYDREAYVKILLELYSQLDDYLDAVLEFEQKRSDLGLFMQPEALEQVISQIQEFVDESENNYLITTFNERVDEMTTIDGVAKEKYKADTKNMVINEIIPAYKEFIVNLNKLKGTHKSNGQLANLPEGKRYYQYLLENGSGTIRTPEEVFTLATEHYNLMVEEQIKLYEKNPKIIEEYNKISPKISDPSEILSVFREKMKGDFPEIDLDEVIFKPYPKSYESSGSLAMYFFPQIDESVTNTIMLNNGALDSSLPINRVKTIGHEGLPGHMYQMNYFKNNNDLLARNVFSFTGYSEGWTRYTENYSVAYADVGSEDVVKLAQLLNMMDCYIYIMMEIEIHYYGLTLDDAIKQYETIGLPKEVVTNIYNTLLYNPGLFTPYSVGLMELVEMRMEAEGILGDKFDDVAFHKMYLDVGPAPFSVVWNAFDQYIEASGGKVELKDAA